MAVGLFFGSFNPIHKGHLEIAHYFLDNSDLKEVWFVVSPQNPLKGDIELLDIQTRLELVQAGIQGQEQIKCCEVELSLPKPSFTIDTMRELDKLHPEEEFVIIMGADNLKKLKLWKDYETILQQYKIYVYPRTGSTGSDFENHPSVTLIESELLDVSATMLRERIRNDEFDRWLPDPVRKIIKERGYYRSSV